MSVDDLMAAWLASVNAKKEAQYADRETQRQHEQGIAQEDMEQYAGELKRRVAAGNLMRLQVEIFRGEMLVCHEKAVADRLGVILKGTSI